MDGVSDAHQQGAKNIGQQNGKYSTDGSGTSEIKRRATRSIVPAMATKPIKVARKVLIMNQLLFPSKQGLVKLARMLKRKHTAD
jgi:hypothetical protein